MISKLQFLFKKILNFFFSSNVFLQLLVIKTLDPDPESMHLDPKHCFQDQRNLLETGKVGTGQGRKRRSFFIDKFFFLGTNAD